MSNEIIRRVHTINLHWKNGTGWNGNAIISNQRYDAALKYPVSLEGEAEDRSTPPLVHIDLTRFSFPDPDGELHSVDMAPIDEQMDALFAKVEALKTPTHPSKDGKKDDQWHLDTDAAHPENSVIHQSEDGVYTLRVRAMLYRKPGSKEKPDQRYLITLWRSGIQASSAGFRSTDRKM